MWIAKIINNNPEFAQMQLDAQTESQLIERVLGFLQTEQVEWTDVVSPFSRVVTRYEPQVTQIPAVLDPETQEELEPAREEVTLIEIQVTEYAHPVEFSIVIEDKTAELEAVRLREERIQRGKADRLKCETALDLIAGFNRERILTMEQITQMQQLFAQAETALRSSRPDFAHALISLIEADGVLVTQEMKDQVLDILV